MFNNLSFRLAFVILMSTAVFHGASTTSIAARVSPLNNVLTDHASPYLKLHGEDPVHWQDWNADVVERARSEDKLLFLSVGYFSCHWCHVMQRESYQDPGVAEIINEHYIPVKIDRELHPALDARLMDFAVSLHGRGGWPLNVFLTPDGHPLFAVFYRPRESFADVITRLNDAWRDNREKLKELAKEEARGQEAQMPVANGSADTVSGTRFAAGLLQAVEQVADEMNGGFGEQSKFPQTPQLEFILNRIEVEPNEYLEKFLVTTLDAIANKGMRDHVDGGFFRYTVDPSWDLPHFEKMLYTNAQLSRLYIRAGEVLKKPHWIDVARDTLNFMIDEMQTTSGGMVAAFSAIDANDVEGGYYLWTDEQLAELFDEPQLAVAKAALSMDGTPALSHGFLPHRNVPIGEIASLTGMTEDKVRETLNGVIQQLASTRAVRELPTDTKLLAGWNGLALNSMAFAARVLDEPRYVEAAKKLRDFLVNELWDGEALVRARVDGSELGSASVEDYAYVGQGLVAWATLTGEKSDWVLAKSVLEQGWSRFKKDDGWFRSEQSLITLETPQPAIGDGALASPSGVMIDATLQLIASDHASSGSEKTAVDGLREQAELALNVAPGYLESNLFVYSTYIDLLVARESEE